MSAKDIAIDVLACEPCRSVLSWCGSTDWGRKFLNLLGRPRGVYVTFAEAWAAARRSAHAGHDHPDYIKLHADLSGIRASDYAVLYWLEQIRPRDIRIFDFAGNIGNLFYNYFRYLSSDSRTIDWTVFDLSKTVEEGRKLAVNRNSVGLAFTDSLESFSPDQILVVSSAFHYLETSVRQFIEQFPARPEHIIVNRTPVVDDKPTFVTVQYAGTYSLPCMIRNSAKLISDFDSVGYEMVDRWNAPELSIRIPFFPTRTVHTYAGFYFQKRKPK